MEPDQALSFLSYAFEKKQDELLFQRWISEYQYMGFREFKERLRPVIPKSDADILRDVKSILGDFTGRKEEPYE